LIPPPLSSLSPLFPYTTLFRSLDGPEAVDVFYDGSSLEVLGVQKIGNHAVSGAGCSLAAAVTAELAKGRTELEAAERAKDFVTGGINQRIEAATPYDVMWQGGLRRMPQESAQDTQASQ